MYQPPAPTAAQLAVLVGADIAGRFSHMHTAASLLSRLSTTTAALHVLAGPLGETQRLMQALVQPIEWPTLPPASTPRTNVPRLRLRSRTRRKRSK